MPESPIDSIHLGFREVAGLPVGSEGLTKILVAANNVFRMTKLMPLAMPKHPRFIL